MTVNAYGAARHVSELLEAAGRVRDDIAYFESLCPGVDADKEGLADTLNFLREKLRRLESAANVLRWGRA